jgi:hypothetical protein
MFSSARLISQMLPWAHSDLWAVVCRSEPRGLAGLSAPMRLRRDLDQTTYVVPASKEGQWQRGGAGTVTQARRRRDGVSGFAATLCAAVP